MKINTAIALGILMLFSCKKNPPKPVPCHEFSKICEHDKDYQLIKVIDRPNYPEATFLMKGCWYVRQSSDNSFVLVTYGEGFNPKILQDTLEFLDKYFEPQNVHKVFKRDTFNLKVQYGSKDYFFKSEVLLLGPNTVSFKMDTIRDQIFCNKFYIKPLPPLIPVNKK